MGLGALREFFRQRYQLGGLADLFTHKVVPAHRHTFWYYWGGITLLLVTIQIASGVLLLLYYHPSAQEAYESVRFIMTKVSFGWLIRSVHAWAANLAIFAVAVHLGSTFFLRAYRPPRELTWVTGVCLFFLLLGFGFTGYLLPWNMLAFFATKVGTEIAGVVPCVGPLVQTFLRGGSDVSDVTLTRFFWFHIAVLPLSVVGVLVLHLVMVQLQGMSKPPSVRHDRSMPFFPNFLLRDLLAWLVVLAGVLLVSVQWPAALGEKADPFAATPAGIRPEWYFLWMFQTLKLFPSHVLGIEGELLAVGLTSLAGAVLLLVPWLDRPARRGQSHWIVTAAGILGLLYVIGMTVYALRAPGQG